MTHTTLANIGAEDLLEVEEGDVILFQEEVGGDRAPGEGGSGVGAERVEVRNRPVSLLMPNKWGRPEIRPGVCMTMGCE